MEIKWYGQSCFQLTAPEGVVVMDPYHDEVGWPLPPLTADILTISHDHFDHNARDRVTASQVFDAPGQYQPNGIPLLGVLADHDASGGRERGKVVMFKVTLEGIRLLHLGDLGIPLTRDQLSAIGEVDVLLVPVGGRYTLDGREAAEVAQAIKPKIVIPMHYALPGIRVDIEGVENFVTSSELTPETKNSLVIDQATLPPMGTKLVLLSRVA